MKILIASDMYYPTLGGISVATDHLATELSKDGHRVTLLAPSVSAKLEKMTINENFIIYSVGSFILLKNKGFRFVFDKKNIEKTIREVDPDVIHVVTPGFGMVSSVSINMARSMKKPLVASNHVVAANMAISAHLPSIVEKGIEKIGVRRMRDVYKKVDRIIVPTPAGKKYLLDIGITTPIDSISNGIYIDRFSKPKKKAIENLRKKLALSDKIIILYVGRFDKEKKTDFLLEAFLILSGQVDVHLLMVGKGTAEEDLKDFVKDKDLGKLVTFAGFLEPDELSAIYSLSDIFVMPSPIELQSLVTMEAMSASLPVVGADAMALPHLIHHGKNGYLFDQNNKAGLAKYLRRLVEDKGLREKMGKRSFEYIQEHAMEKVVKKFVKLYDSVIRRV